jgi:hypothetical protein
MNTSKNRSFNPDEPELHDPFNPPQPNRQSPEKRITYNPTTASRTLKHKELKQKKSSKLKNFESPIVDINEYAGELRLGAMNSNDGASPKPDYHNPENFAETSADKILDSKCDSLNGCDTDDSASCDSVSLDERFFFFLLNFGKANPGSKV